MGQMPKWVFSCVCGRFRSRCWHHFMFGWPSFFFAMLLPVINVIINTFSNFFKLSVCSKKPKTASVSHLHAASPTRPFTAAFLTFLHSTEARQERQRERERKRKSRRYPERGWLGKWLLGLWKPLLRTSPPKSLLTHTHAAALLPHMALSLMTKGRRASQPCSRYDVGFRASLSLAQSSAVQHLMPNTICGLMTQTYTVHLRRRKGGWRDLMISGCSSHVTSILAGDQTITNIS